MLNYCWRTCFVGAKKSRTHVDERVETRRGHRQMAEQSFLRAGLGAWAALVCLAVCLILGRLVRVR